MKRFFQRVKQQFISFVTPADIPVNDPPLLVSTESLQLHYVPAADEPSLFTNKKGEINPRWAAWYFKRNTNHGYMKMLMEADLIRRRLAIEPPRDYDNTFLPDIVVGKPLVISFAWIIWYKHEFEVSFEEAYHEARFITHAE